PVMLALPVAGSVVRWTFGGSDGWTSRCAGIVACMSAGEILGPVEQADTISINAHILVNRTLDDPRRFMVDLPHGRLPHILEPLLLGIELIDGGLLGLRVGQRIAERGQLRLRV